MAEFLQLTDTTWGLREAMTQVFNPVNDVVDVVDYFSRKYNVDCATPNFPFLRCIQYVAKEDQGKMHYQQQQLCYITSEWLKLFGNKDKDVIIAQTVVLVGWNCGGIFPFFVRSFMDLSGAEGRYFILPTKSVEK